MTPKNIGRVSPLVPIRRRLGSRDLNNPPVTIVFERNVDAFVPLGSCPHRPDPPMRIPSCSAPASTQCAFWTLALTRPDPPRRSRARSQHPARLSRPCPAPLNPFAAPVLEPNALRASPDRAPLRSSRAPLLDAFPTVRLRFVLVPNSTSAFPVRPSIRSRPRTRPRCVRPRFVPVSRLTVDVPPVRAPRVQTHRRRPRVHSQMISVLAT